MALPILISIPHGGSETPPEVVERVIATPAEIFEDGDAFTREIYDLGDRVAHVQSARIARAFVDLNRAEDDRPPENRDGVVKTATCFDRPVYSTPLDLATTELLLGRYHRPYHAGLAEATRHAGAALGLDCHSMAALPPPVAPDAGRPRPLFCLSNAEGRTCDPDVVARLAGCLAEAFDCPPHEVAVNQPFKGGYIVQRHGRNPLPWIQVEMNRSLYLARPWFDGARRLVDPERLRELRERFGKALTSFMLPGERRISPGEPR
jgi:N-formylglutamate deformylase